MKVGKTYYAINNQNSGAIIITTKYNGEFLLRTQKPFLLLSYKFNFTELKNYLQKKQKNNQKVVFLK
jgi:hypothetical protein